MLYPACGKNELLSHRCFAVGHEGVQHFQQGGVIGVVQFVSQNVIAQTFGSGPVSVGVLTLRDGVGKLSAQSGQRDVFLNSGILLGSQVGGTPANGLIAGELHIGTGQVSGQRVAGGEFVFVGLGLDTQHLESAEAAQLRSLVGGQLGGGVVLAEQILRS